MEIIHHETLEESVLYNPIIISNITQQLCLLPRLAKGMREDFKALFYTNKFFYCYYSAEKNQQTIVRTYARYNYLDEKLIASILGCHEVHKKINYLGYCSFT